MLKKEILYQSFIFSILLFVFSNVMAKDGVYEEGHEDVLSRKPIPEGESVVEGEFVFLFKNSNNLSSNEIAIELEQFYKEYGIKPNRVFNHLGGFSASLTDKTLPLKKSISDWIIAPNVTAALNGRELQTGFSSGNHPWGLDRIDDPWHTLNFSYQYYNDGTSVDAYVVDSGIRATHEDLRGRVSPGFTAHDDGWGTSDCEFHGTAVASIIGGTWHGVAKNINLVPVKVENCITRRFSTADILAGLDWVLGEVRTSNRPSVINMSITKAFSFNQDPDPFFVAAINLLREEGAVVVVSAGNDGKDTCHYGIANTPDAITVGASTRGDKRWDSSNFGSCVDIFAPGHRLPGAHGESDDGISRLLSGTSFAAPHVAGVVAQLFERYSNYGYSGLRLAEFVEQQVIYASLIVGDIDEENPGSPNLLLSNYRHGIYDELPYMSGMRCKRQQSGTLLIEWNPQPSPSFVLESSEDYFSGVVIDGSRNAIIIDNPVSISEPIDIRMFASGVTGRYPNWSEWVSCI